MKISWSLLWHEFQRLVRFGIIGVLSFVLYFFVYAALSRWLWTHGNRTVENVLAICVASVFNFLGHGRWTFRSEARHHTQIIRYSLVVGTAIALQSLLFWIGHEFLHLYDFAVAFIVAVIVAFYTYLMHRGYTFRHAASSSSMAHL
jgi:putative flippase GtrA